MKKIVYIITTNAVMMKFLLVTRRAVVFNLCMTVVWALVKHTNTQTPSQRVAAMETSQSDSNAGDPRTTVGEAPI